MSKYATWLQNLLGSAIAAKDALEGKRPVFHDIGARDGLSVIWDLLAKLDYVEALGFEPDRNHAAFLSNRCLLYTSPSPRDATLSRMPSSA